MLTYSERLKLCWKYKVWIDSHKEYEIADSPELLIAYLEYNNLLKTEEARNFIKIVDSNTDI